jgi:hypothetical protein
VILLIATTSAITADFVPSRTSFARRRSLYEEAPTEACYSIGALLRW